MVEIWIGMSSVVKAPPQLHVLTYLKRTDTAKNAVRSVHLNLAYRKKLNLAMGPIGLKNMSRFSQLL